MLFFPLGAMYKSRELYPRVEMWEGIFFGGGDPTAIHEGTFSWNKNETSWIRIFFFFFFDKGYQSCFFFCSVLDDLLLLWTKITTSFRVSLSLCYQRSINSVLLEITARISRNFFWIAYAKGTRGSVLWKGWRRVGCISLRLGTP